MVRSLMESGFKIVFHQPRILMTLLTARNAHLLRSIPSSIHNCRQYSIGAISLKTRHLLSTADLSSAELNALLSRSAELKRSVKTRNLLTGVTKLTPGP